MIKLFSFFLLFLFNLNFGVSENCLPPTKKIIESKAEDGTSLFVCGKSINDGMISDFEVFSFEKGYKVLLFSSDDAYKEYKIQKDVSDIKLSTLPKSPLKLILNETYNSREKAIQPIVTEFRCKQKSCFSKIKCNFKTNRELSDLAVSLTKGCKNIVEIFNLAVQGNISAQKIFDDKIYCGKGAEGLDKAAAFRDDFNRLKSSGCISSFFTNI